MIIIDTEIELACLLRTGMPKHFIIIGNGGGGTSLLRGLLNAHSKMTVLFEDKPGGTPDNEIDRWIDKAKDAETKGLIWANKRPLEQFNSCKWEGKNYVELAKYFKIIWIVRRFSKYIKPQTKQPYIPEYKKNWKRLKSFYWLTREAYPAGVIQVSFEDLLLRTVIELKRMCRFIGVQYESAMNQGTLNTGYKRFDQKTINIEKI